MEDGDVTFTLRCVIESSSVNNVKSERVGGREEEGRKEGRKEGEASGKIEESKATVFDLLKDKGEIPPDTAGRINGEEDLQILRKWVRLAAKTDSIAGFEAEM